MNTEERETPMTQPNPEALHHGPPADVYGRGTGLTAHVARPSDPAVVDANIVYVAIGRNVGDQPMIDLAWQYFQDTTRRALVEVLGVEPLVYFGEGEWEGVKEESAVFAVFTARGISLNARTLIRRRMERLADLYRQDAIAVTYGTSTLVTPR